MGEITTIGLDIAKSVFQAHGADASGSVLFRKKLPRSRLLAFFASQQARGVVFRARDLLVSQRTQIINALRGHMAEYGWVAARAWLTSSAWWSASRIRRKSCQKGRGPA